MRPSWSISSGEPNACAESCISSSRCSADIELSIRWAAAARLARASSSSSTSRGRPAVSEEVAVLVHEPLEVLLGVVPQPVLLQQLVEVA